jgi:hypothetical protein
VIVIKHFEELINGGSFKKELFFNVEKWFDTVVKELIKTGALTNH